mmetsp:Transcript_52018/g.161765  ORF Transcript_52018/g.161765 Transcript_52018/m.161765 type:complete len:277 (-) Transcript_52018:13-843(-)
MVLTLSLRLLVVLCHCIRGVWRSRAVMMVHLCGGDTWRSIAPEVSPGLDRGPLVLNDVRCINKFLALHCVCNGDDAGNVNGCWLLNGVLSIFHGHSRSLNRDLLRVHNLSWDLNFALFCDCLGNLNNSLLVFLHMLRDICHHWDHHCSRDHSKNRDLHFFGNRNYHFLLFHDCLRNRDNLFVDNGTRLLHSVFVRLHYSLGNLDVDRLGFHHDFLLRYRCLGKHDLCVRYSLLLCHQKPIHNPPIFGPVRSTWYTMNRVLVIYAVWSIVRHALHDW